MVKFPKAAIEVTQVTKAKFFACLGHVVISRLEEIINHVHCAFEHILQRTHFVRDLELASKMISSQVCYFSQFFDRDFLS